MRLKCGRCTRVFGKLRDRFDTLPVTPFTICVLLFKIGIQIFVTFAEFNMMCERNKKHILIYFLSQHQCFQSVYDSVVYHRFIYIDSSHPLPNTCRCCQIMFIVQYTGIYIHTIVSDDLTKLLI